MLSSTLFEIAAWATIIATGLGLLAAIAGVGAFIFRWVIAYNDIQALKKTVYEDMSKQFDRIHKRIDGLIPTIPTNLENYTGSSTSSPPNAKLKEMQSETSTPLLEQLLQEIQQSKNQNPLDEEGV